MVVAIAVISAFTVSVAAPVFITPLLQRMGVVDIPNERSSHSRQAIRGVGLAALLGLVVGYAVLLIAEPGQRDVDVLLVVFLTSVAAGALGWIEDSRGLPVHIRAGIQLLLGVGAAGVISAMTDDSIWMIPFLAVGIAGYINVANFMDGIDGISSLHGIVAGAAYAILGGISGEFWLVSAGLVLAVVFGGFLPWNLIRGGMFLGDTGSYLLGGGIAVVGTAAIVAGLPVLAVLGPLAIYLSDAGVTLIRRVYHREKWYEAHRSHVYQKLTDAGLSHGAVAVIVAAASAATAALGAVAMLQPQLWWVSALGMAGCVAAYFLLRRFIPVSRLVEPGRLTKGEIIE